MNQPKNCDIWIELLRQNNEENFEIEKDSESGYNIIKDNQIVCIVEYNCITFGKIDDDAKKILKITKCKNYVWDEANAVGTCFIDNIIIMKTGDYTYDLFDNKQNMISIRFVKDAVVIKPSNNTICSVFYKILADYADIAFILDYHYGEKIDLALVAKYNLDSKRGYRMVKILPFVPQILDY